MKTFTFLLALWGLCGRHGEICQPGLATQLALGFPYRCCKQGDHESCGSPPLHCDAPADGVIVPAGPGRNSSG